MTVIFTTHKLHPDVTTDLQALADLRIASAPTPGAIDLESGGADIIVVRAPIAAGIVQREPNLRACVRHGAGLDMIPVDVATKSGVLVANVPGANAITVAEHVIWSALALLALLFSTVRRRNGFAGLHGLATDTRVVRDLPAEVSAVWTAAEAPVDDAAGLPSRFGPFDVTFIGAPMPRALNTGSKMWHPMSPRVPQPKSFQPRQFPG